MKSVFDAILDKYFYPRCISSEHLAANICTSTHKKSILFYLDKEKKCHS